MSLTIRDPQTLALLHLDSRALPQYLTREQIPELVAHCRSERDRMFVRIGFETGGRVSELLELRKSDIDLSNRQIRLHTLKRKRGDRRRQKKEVFRWIPVSAGLCADLANYLLGVAMRTPGNTETADHAERRALLEAVAGEFSADAAAGESLRRRALEILQHFPGPDFKELAQELARVRAPHRVARLLLHARKLEAQAGRLAENMRLFPFSRQNAHKIIKQAARRAGLLARGGREVSPHILRHSFAMNCLTQGVPITVLKDLLGHTAISSTMIYLKTHPVEAREFLSKVKF